MQRSPQFCFFLSLTFKASLKSTGTGAAMISPSLALTHGTDKLGSKPFCLPAARKVARVHPW